MSDFKLKKSIWGGEGYYYLSKADSDLYDKLQSSNNPKDMKIVELILDKAEAEYSIHCADNS